MTGLDYEQIKEKIKSEKSKGGILAVLGLVGANITGLSGYVARHYCSLNPEFGIERVFPIQQPEFYCSDYTPAIVFAVAGAVTFALVSAVARSYIIGHSLEDVLDS